jgi:hypothetical protein
MDNGSDTLTCPKHHQHSTHPRRDAGDVPCATTDITTAASRRPRGAHAQTRGLCVTAIRATRPVRFPLPCMSSRRRKTPPWLHRIGFFSRLPLIGSVPYHQAALHLPQHPSLPTELTLRSAGRPEVTRRLAKMTLSGVSARLWAWGLRRSVHRVPRGGAMSQSLRRMTCHYRFVSNRRTLD